MQHRKPLVLVVTLLFAITLGGAPFLLHLFTELQNNPHPLTHWLLIIGGSIVSASLIYLMFRLQRRSIKLQRDLQKAIELDQFEVHYMPIFDIEKNKVVSAEALVRWRHPEKGLLLPDKFIAIAEATGQIQQLTQRVVQHVAIDMQRFLEKHRQFLIAINLSAVQFETLEIFDACEAILKKHNIQADQIKYEITESSVLNTRNLLTQEVMKEIRQRKSSLAVDDFGTGYSKVHLYSGLPLNYVKLDKQLLSNVSYLSRGERLASHLIECAKSLNIEVIAEGVETEAQIEYLRDHGVTHVQGWYISKALPAEDFLHFIRNKV